jgi:hypothetical protein
MNVTAIGRGRRKTPLRGVRINQITTKSNNHIKYSSVFLSPGGALSPGSPAFQGREQHGEKGRETRHDDLLLFPVLRSGALQRLRRVAVPFMEPLFTSLWRND